jgi:tetratricopeptide (TPR) repeat protein
VPPAIVLLSAIALAACGSPSSEPADGEQLVVVVLPFEVQGQQDGADYVGRAVAESVAISLAQAEDLRLLESPNGTDPAVEGATRLITGKLVREGESVRAALQLRDPVKDALLWETEISSDGGDLSALASRLAMHTIEQMGVSLPDRYDYIGAVTGGTEMSESPLTARAQESWRRNDIEALLETSTTLVDDDPAAHVLNAWALMFAWDATPSTEDYLSQLRERLVTLDRVDPSSPYDELIRGYIYRSSGQPEQARASYSQVLTRTDISSTARAWALRQRSFTYLQVGNAEAARGDAEEAVGLDPSNASSHVALSKSLEALDRLDGAISRAEQALALQPVSWRQHQRLGLVLTRASKFDEAAVSLDRACRLSDSQEACANLAVVLHRGGREEEARTAATHAESLAASGWGYYNLACFWSLAGKRTQAIDGLSRSLELGFADALLDTDPDLDSLRDDPGFQAILEAVEDRLNSRRQLTKSVFPWQARIATSPSVSPA